LTIPFPLAMSGKGAALMVYVGIKAAVKVSYYFHKVLSVCHFLISVYYCHFLISVYYKS